MMNKHDKYEMEKWLDSLSFCAVDMKLYMDTHPKDEEAKEYYRQCLEVLDSAKKMYDSEYGVNLTPWEGQ